ncbi:hypothetical protein [uncultured Pseudokineococcus sp.]|uniref:hypothetical protein n=1 Tax=uncultured Pseudokineococcus sp. TaxID=1642928 RepID=UPI00262FCE8E|nr:hypothetical protein [uncultured Pseudokineococcus sp.]
MAADGEVGPVVGVHLRRDRAVGVRAGDGSSRTAAAAGSPATSLAAVLAELAPERCSRVLLDLAPLVADVLEGGRLAAVTTVRIAPSDRAIGVLYGGWPPAVVEQVDAGRLHVSGGHDFHGRRVGDVDEEAIAAAGRLAVQRGADVMAVSAVGAMIDSSLELEVAARLSRATGRHVVMSHGAGGVRHLERETTTVLDGALRGEVGALLDELYDVVDHVAPGARPGFAAADGSWLGREQARAHALRLLGTREALLVQGAAATAGTPSAHVLLRDRRGLRATAVDDGCVRADPVRDLAPWLPGVHANQRHASVLPVGPGDASGLSPAALLGRPVVLVDLEPRADEGEVPQRLVAAGLEVRQVAAAPDVLLARGLCAAVPQCEVVTYAAVDGPAAWQRARDVARHQAQAQVLAADPRARLRTVADQVIPLSYLSTGVVQVRCYVVAEQELVRA